MESLTNQIANKNFNKLIPPPQSAASEKTSYSKKAEVP